MKDNKVILERMLMSNCIKYDVLADIAIDAFSESNAKAINIYIDTYSILKSMYSDIDISYGKYNIVTSSLLNIAIHYKYFFTSRFKIEANVYLINSTNTCPINKRYVSDYNYGHEQRVESNKISTDIINKNRIMLQRLTPYLPGIYYIETDFESGVVIHDLMLRTDINDEKGHCVITKDAYNYQLVGSRNESIVIRNKRDESLYVDKGNLYNMHAYNKNIKTSSNILSYELYTLMMALNNLPERNIKTIYSINKIVNSLENAITNGKLLNQYNSDIKYVCNILRDDMELNEISIMNRFRAIDIPFQHGIYYSSAEKDLIELSLVDKVDPDTVRHINNTEFQTNPLNLNNI